MNVFILFRQPQHMHSEQQEIERILKEIYACNQSLSDHTFYYKKKHGFLISVNTVLSEEFKFMLRKVFDPNLEYALYIEDIRNITPLFDCMEAREYVDIIRQLIGYFPVDEYKDFDTFIEGATGIKHNTGGIDPLSQILAYQRTLSPQWPKHVYLCPRVYRVKSCGSDPASIFHGKDGVVAYCMSLRGFALAEISVGIINVYRQLRDVEDRAIRKLRFNNELRELWSQDRVKACDIDLVKGVIHDEIEEANTIMKGYGIMRITIPLD